MWLRLLSVTPHRVFKSNWYAINYLHPSFLIERSLLVGAVDRPHFYHSNGGFISVFFFWNSSLTSGFRQQQMVCQIYDTPFCTCLSVVKFNLFLLLAYRHSPDTDRLLFFMIVIIRTLWFEWSVRVQQAAPAADYKTDGAWTENAAICAAVLFG